MKDFPDFLQADISLHLNRNLLRESNAFKGVNHGCLRALSMKFQVSEPLLLSFITKLNVS